MDINSNLLNEVIADAKAVKETAVATALGTLKETFEPTVRRLISQKLAEEGEIEDDPEMDAPEDEITEGEYNDDGDDGTPADNLSEEEMDDMDSELEEILRELEGADMEDGMEDEEEMDDMTESEDEYDDELTSEDIDAMIAEMEGEDDMPEDEPDVEDMAEMRMLAKENAKLKAHLKEAYKAITAQKNTINEVNMLNSKLLFLTKIINKHNIGPNQQVKILEAFDRCNTVREVQLTYATLSETMSKSRQTKITESASKRARSIKPQRINEQYSYASRWKELAGITG